MELYLTDHGNETDKNYIRNGLIEFNLKHFPDELKGRYQAISLYLKDPQGIIYGGLTGEFCWNWLEIHYLYVHEDFRKSGYGQQLLAEAEKRAKEKKCDFIKVDTLSFQAVDFYKKQGYQVYGMIENAGGFTHYYLKKDLLITPSYSILPT